MNKLIFSLLFLAYLLPFGGRAQNFEEIPVSMHTGTPTIQVPIFTLRDRDLLHPIYLSYSANGVRLDESSGLYGTGWSMNAGGSISRVVRGLPDDFTGASKADKRRGWLYGTHASTVQSFGTADLSAATCGDEGTDIDAISTFNYALDTEPDIFTFSCGGISGSFVLDPAGTVRLFPFQDIKITYTTVSSSDKRILSFTVTDNKGVRYLFDQRVLATRKSNIYPGVTSVEFLKRDFELYNQAKFATAAEFATEWKVSVIESPSGSAISFQYETSPQAQQVDTVSMAVRHQSSSTYPLHKIYTTETTVAGKILTIAYSSSGTVIGFLKATSNLDLITKISINDTRRAENSFVKEFILDYGKAYNKGNTSSPHFRFFLKSVTEKSGCDQLPPYKFNYYGVSLVGESMSYPGPYSKSRDFWGYYNGRSNTEHVPAIYIYPQLAWSERFRLTPLAGVSGYTLTGADRTPDYLSAAIGTLDAIEFPSGGSAKMIFEPNEYYDAVALQSYLGGGLRIKQINYFDGISLNEMIKTFEYKAPQNVSSGYLLQRPAFVVPTWKYKDPSNNSIQKTYQEVNTTTQNLWEHLAVRSKENLSYDEVNNSNVVYSHVTVKRPGSGSATFTYSLPATYGTSDQNDWLPTVTKFVRPSPCANMGVIDQGGSWGVSYAPNSNYGFENGLLLTKSEYTEAGVLVRKITNTYQRLIKSGSNPFKVWGLRYDKYANSTDAIYLYGKYALLTEVENVLLTETETLHDGTGITTTTQHYYESSYHKLLTKVKKTNSDGTIYYSKFRYPLDFGTIPSSGTDKNSEMIRKLQLEFRNGVTIEEVRSIHKTGGSEEVTGALLTKFSDFGTIKVLPEKILELRLSTPISNFTSSSIQLQSGQYVFSNDSRYEVVRTFLSYDKYHLPLTWKEKTIAPQAVLWGYNKSEKVAELFNVLPSQMAFSDFETTTGREFTVTPESIMFGGYGGSKSAAKPTLTKTIEKAPTDAYLLSFRIKPLLPTVSITVKIFNDQLVELQTQTLTFSASSNFQYYETRIPVTSFPGTFILEIKSQTKIKAGAGYQMDDVTFIPENAQLVARDYTIPYGPTSVKNGEKASFIMYDNLGRTKYQLDKHKNIRKKLSYKYAVDPVQTLVAGFTVQDQAYDNTPIIFYAQENCIDGVTFEWDFGSGYVTGLKNQWNTFATPGTKTVSLRLSHPGYTTQVITKQVVVLQKALTVTSCAKGIAFYDLCTLDGAFYHSCAQITTPVTGKQTIMKVTGITGGTAPYTYYWTRTVVSSGLNYPAGTTEEIAISDYYWGTSDFYCVVTDSQGRVGVSGMTRVTVDKSDPNCNGPFGN